MRYSDKKRVARFRIYAAKLYEREGLRERLLGLTAKYELNGALRLEGMRAREEDARAGWDRVKWKEGFQAESGTLRGDVDEMIRLLEDFAANADRNFFATFGGSTKRRGMKARLLPSSVWRTAVL